MEKVVTNDGSFTFVSSRFKEPYHSITAGAFREAIEKFCKPCLIEKKAKEGSVNLFDVCFGLGYNSIAFLDVVFKTNPLAEVHIVGFEFDIKVIESSLTLDWGKFEKWKRVLRIALRNKLFEEGFITLNFFSPVPPRIKLKIYIGEGRRIIKKFGHRYANFADAIFHDPFSPKVNPELWTLEFFDRLKKIIKKEGILATYSAASCVRKALHLVGFGVKEGVAIGRKSKSTLASLAFETDEKLLKKFSISTESTPFRDLELEDSPKLIKARRLGCISLQNIPVPVVPRY
jgi:tRNA U34 5-methylaminomethyl-2-thiouridine-forming methyltransferase MnmC